MNYILLIFGLGLALIFLISSITSIAERQKRATFLSFLGLILLPTLYIAPLFFQNEAPHYYSYALIVLSITFIIALLYNPYNPNYKTSTPNHIFDERDTMFSRMELVPGTEKFNQYYATKPENKEKDNLFRQQPGLLSPKAVFYNPLAFNAADANFYTVSKLGPFINDKVSSSKVEIDAEDLSIFVKEWVKKLGAIDVGICLMKDYHYYHTKGRRETYGKKITPRYKYGIALTVEMSEQMIKVAPKGSVIMESAEQYLKSGVIAVTLAAFLRNLGYEAQAHIDGNYEVICPLVARDAGLGEIGRMGLLMTHNLGPRVRIAVVTTNAPLQPYNGKVGDESVIEFCTKCKKCAENCPSQSIPYDDRSISDNTLRWKINSESCFTYWTKVGTDCGRCIQVCPYSHPNNLMHNMIRFGIKHSKLFRIMALHLDDLFYKRKPPLGKLPYWVEYKPSK